MKIILLVFCLSISLLAEFDKQGEKNKNNDEPKSKYQISPEIKDTLYTLGNYFIEVNLSTQIAYLHSRFDSTFSFGVSTGTKRVKDGVETNEGIYAIQFKVEKWYSIQFDSTMMLNFMTFNWGIGFHALAGNSYYKYLGVKKSSHGCVRVSRTIAKDLYKKVKYGTPVIVHNGYPAVQIAFATYGQEGLNYLAYPDLKSKVTEQLQKLYKGNYLLEKREKLLIDNNNVTHSGLPIGDARKINKRQLMKPDYLFIDYVMPSMKDFYKFDNNIISSIEPVLIKGKIPLPESFIDE